MFDFVLIYVINQVILDIIIVVFHTYLILNSQIINQNKLTCLLSFNRLHLSYALL